ncbi:unnamed protein product, partial [marine sediment metagenome]
MKAEQELQKAKETHELKVQTRIAELRQAETQIEIFRKFTDASEQGMGISNLEGNIIYSNSALCRILGEESPEATYKKNVREYYTEEDRTRLEKDILPAVIKQGHYTAEIPLMSVKGKVLPTIQSIFLIRNEHDKPQ